MISIRHAGLHAGRALAVFALLAGGCRSRATADECQALAEHYVDLASREAPGASNMSPAQLAAIRDVERGIKRAEPSFRAVEDQCNQVTRAEVSCAIASTSTKAWEACLQDSSR